MSNPPEPSKQYLQTLLRYYEEEVSGEAYFYALADHFAEREKVILLARIERRAAEAVLPLLEKYGLTPRDETICHSEGKSHLETHQSYSWQEFMTYMVERYPGYVEDFRALEQMAPAGDLRALSVLTDHEVAVIDFAEKELAGNPDSLAPLLKYLQ